MLTLYHFVLALLHHTVSLQEFERSKIMDKHLAILARKYLPTRFIRLDAEKSPFFVDKLQIKILPTVVLFKDGIAVDRIQGFSGIGDEQDDFSTADLIARLKSGRHGVLRSLSAEGAERDGDSEDEALEAARRGRVRQSARGNEYDEVEDRDEENI